MKNVLHNLFWASSTAMSWTWGLGLFFSVQIAIQFGITGLLAFAIPNAVGLFLFGLLTHRASRNRSAGEFEKGFFEGVKGYGWVLLLYQVLALVLTFFAGFRYVALPVGIAVPLAFVVLLGAGLFLGERFDIARIKYSHAVLFLLTAASAVAIVAWLPRALPDGAALAPPRASVASFHFAGYLVPMVIGLLLGPWLDLQQWQRAIRIRREGRSLRAAYGIGSLLFFAILLFHGILASVVFRQGGPSLVPPSHDGLFHAKDAVVRFFFQGGIGGPLAVLQVAYVAFLFLLLVTTLDSGYVALRWYIGESLGRSKNPILAMVPVRIVGAPVFPFAGAAVLGLAAVWLRFELEYFIAFYATFAVGYEIFVLWRGVVSPRFRPANGISVFALAALSLGLFGIGFLQQMPALAIAATLIPFAHAAGTVATWKPQPATHIPRPVSDDEVAAPPADAVLQTPAAIATTTGGGADGAAATPGITTWFEGKWFVHALMSTYTDTNSVGNIYFTSYASWVGKTRELFFRHAMPDFDLKTTPFYILTREFQHKFIREAREFEQIFVKIKVASWNRKFVTLEHEVLDGARRLLGKGKQVLFFVSRKDYSLLDLPVEIQNAFRPFVVLPSLSSGQGGEA